MNESLLEIQNEARGLFFNLCESNEDGIQYLQGIPGNKGYAKAQPVKGLGPIGNVAMIDHNGMVQIFFFEDKRPCAAALKKGPVMQIDVGKECPKSGEKKVFISHPSDLLHDFVEIFAPIIKGLGMLASADTCPMTSRVIYEIAPRVPETTSVFY